MHTHGLQLWLEPPSFSGSFLVSCGRHLTVLRLSNCHSVKRSVLASLAATCASLALLDLASCHLLQSDEFEPLAGLGSLVHLNLQRTQVGSKQLYPILQANPR